MTEIKKNVTKFNLNNNLDVEKFNELFDRVKSTHYISVFSKTKVPYIRSGYGWEEKEKRDSYSLRTQARLRIQNGKLYIYELCNIEEEYNYYQRSYCLGDAYNIEVEEVKTSERLYDPSLRMIGYKTSLNFKINGYVSSIHDREDDMKNN